MQPTGEPDKIILELNMFTTAALYMLGTVICTIILFFLASNFEAANKENVPGIIRREWWRYNRLILTLILLVTILAMVCKFNVLQTIRNLL